MFFFFSHHKTAFLAGVDIQLIASCQSSSEGVEGVKKVKPFLTKLKIYHSSICCVHGLCLGGGLGCPGCDRIIVSDDLNIFAFLK